MPLPGRKAAHRPIDFWRDSRPQRGVRRQLTPRPPGNPAPEPPQSADRSRRSFRQATAVTLNSQPASTVFLRNLRARRAKTRKTARVTAPASSALPVCRYADEYTNAR